MALCPCLIFVNTRLMLAYSVVLLHRSVLLYIRVKTYVCLLANCMCQLILTFAGLAKQKKLISCLIILVCSTVDECFIVFVQKYW